MTRVTKLVMHGFKSFAKHTELEFGPDFNVVLGPNGAGKSCSYSTEVLLNNGEIKKIGEIVESALKSSKKHKKIDDGIFTTQNPQNLRVFGLDTNTHKIVEKNISAFIKREGEPYLYEITTKIGKTVTTTGCHPVMIFKNGKIKSEIVSNLNKNQLIATPKRIPKKIQNKKNLNYIKKSEITKDNDIFPDGFKKTEDIFWDQIVSIKKVKGEPFVYDLTIPNCHNFIGNGIFVHNSNVLDALCFVLGKTSSKSLRAEKSSHLIYNGGKSKKPAKQGMVSIHFDNKNKLFPVEEEEVKITRIVRQNGQSIYKINDQTRTRQQMVELLNLAKVSQDAYNIILQGDIARFVDMPPLERRMLIDEISGISMYEEKKHKAMLDLEKVEKMLNDAQIVLTERNTYLKELKKDRDQALKFKDMNDKINMFRASLLKIHTDKKTKEKQEIDGRLGKNKEEFNKLQEKIEKLKQENQEKNTQVGQITKEIEEKGEVEQVNLNREVEALKIDLTRQSSRLETIKSELVKINKRREDLNSSIKETDANIAELIKQRLQLQDQLKEKTKEKQEFEAKVNEFRGKNKLDDIHGIDKQIEEIDKKAEELQKQVHSFKEKQHGLIRSKDSVQHEINVIDEKIEKVAEIEKEHQKEIEELKNKRSLFKQVTLELNKKLDEDSNLSAQLGSSKEKLYDYNEEYAKLKAKNIEITEMSFGNNAVRSILKQKKINGIHGTVAELGNVNSKYSLALEIAAGPRIKSVVVENEKVASDCIKYLKQNKLGVATFLPLTKIKGREKNKEVSELAKAKGSHGKAIDLIEFDNKFKKVFEYVFSNTVVVDSIDTARRLGIGKAKMVSLDGDLAELSGVMQGGFRDKKKRGMGFKEKQLAKDLSEYETKISELENLIKTLEKRRIENEEVIVDLRKQKAELEVDIAKAEKSLHLEPTDLEISKKKKESLNKESADIEKQVNDIQNEISSVNKNLAELKIEKQNLRAKIAQLRDPALLAELSTYEERIREINDLVIKNNTEIQNINVRTSLIGQEKEKTQKILKQLDGEEETFSTESKELTERIKQRSEILRTKEEQAKAFMTRFKELFKKQGTIKEEIQKNELVVNSKREELTKTEIKNNTLSIKAAELSAQLAGLNQEFQQYEGIQLDTVKNEDQLRYEINKFEKMKVEIGSVNMRALEIYDDIEKEYNVLLEKKERLGNEREDVLNMMQEIEDKKKDMFMKTFTVITEKFREAFSALSTKGEAYLELENPENPFEAGLRVKVKITGMKFLDIRSLSGGEKALTALAFIFAIQEHEPAPFYILDEVDAALDKHNSEKFAKLIARYAEKAQYILISHNDGVITEAGTLYGVSMNEHGMSKVISLKV